MSGRAGDGLRCEGKGCGQRFVDVKIELTNLQLLDKFYFMPKTSKAITQMPPSTVAALEKLGADLAVARLRRRESLKTWSKRLGVTVPTLLRLESGDPGVGMGILATALWLIGRDAELSQLAAPEYDKGALDKDVRQAVALGKQRAQASAEARMHRAEKEGGGQ